MEAPGTVKNQKVDEVHELIQTLVKGKDKLKWDGEAEWRERRNDSTVDFTVWWLIRGGVGDKGGNKGGT